MSTFPPINIKTSPLTVPRDRPSPITSEHKTLPLTVPIYQPSPSPIMFESKPNRQRFPSVKAIHQKHQKEETPRKEIEPALSRSTRVRPDTAPKHGRRSSLSKGGRKTRKTKKGKKTRKNRKSKSKRKTRKI